MLNIFPNREKYDKFEGKFKKRRNMMKNYFKKAAMAMAISAISLPAQAQYLRSSYFMEGASSRTQLNPGLQPTRGYFAIPVVGSLNVSANSNTLGVNDIIDVFDENSDFFMSNSLYDKLKTSNKLNVNLNTDILSMGWLRGKGFWSVNVGLRVDVGARINKGMFDFMRDVNGKNIEELAGTTQSYNLGHQQIRMRAYGEVGLGYSRRITEKLTVGGRMKVLLGLGRAEMNIDKFDVTMDLPEYPSYGSEYSPEDWMGKGYSYEAKGNVMTTLKGGGISFSPTGQIEDFDFEADDLGLAGAGFGIDLGASYEVMDNLTVSAAVLDLGFLKWKKGETRMGSIDESEQTVIDYSNYDQFIDGDLLSLERFNFKEQRDVNYKSKTRLSSTMILAAEYAFFQKKLSVGAMYSAHFVQPETLHDITFSATYRPKNWFNLAASYSPVLAGGKSIGLAAKIGPLFLGTDYMYFGKNSKSVNGFLGIAIPIGQKKKDFSQL